MKVYKHIHTHVNSRITLCSFKIFIAGLFVAIVLLPSCRKTQFEDTSHNVGTSLPKMFPDDQVVKYPESYMKKIHSAIVSFDKRLNQLEKNASTDSVVHKSDARILVQGLGNYRYNDFSNELLGLDREEMVLELPTYVQGDDTLTMISDTEGIFQLLSEKLDGIEGDGKAIYSVALDEQTEHSGAETTQYKASIVTYGAERTLSGYIVWNEADEAMNNAYLPYAPTGPGEYWAYHSQWDARTASQFLDAGLLNYLGEYYGTQDCLGCGGNGFVFNDMCNVGSSTEPLINMSNYNSKRYVWVNYMEDRYSPAKINNMEYISFELAIQPPYLGPCYPRGGSASFV